ncbi:uncharacterized protein LOC118282381 [Spodoptera frugiperda]|uniref:Uncharacterized protein LOC118282381 n=1 Tax=Spodoptera frugiperda TaxID=7108 RepID=A0A9R0ETX1_SPOFR|nr:uncharacterized protein LOC118282381 [Spodoptera frugiperda]
MSPRKKKIKYSPTKAAKDKDTSFKRENDLEESVAKRIKADKNHDAELQARKKQNFMEACKQVSCKAYSDHNARFLETYFPNCLENGGCVHHDKNAAPISQMAPHVEQSFSIEIKNKAWFEALDVCRMYITRHKFLTPAVLQDIVEIILNAHQDDYDDHSLLDVIIKAQQVLSLHFSTHPPCYTKTLRTCYKDFLTSPMNPKDKTFTNRTEFEYRKGIVKYCMNRLEDEISADSKDGPLVDKQGKVPKHLTNTVSAAHWENEKFLIYECLDRRERIKRLMAVLESAVELLQYDLAIWHSRYINNLGTHIMRSHKPLMAFVLWSETVYTGAVTSNCRQIMKLFVHLNHLRYPDDMLTTIAMWLNAMIQTFYFCETNSNSDYPNIGKYCKQFAKEFYKIIAGMPCDSVNRILDRIEPPFMKHLIGMTHIKILRPIQDDYISNILINFFKEKQWLTFPPDESQVIICRPLFMKPIKISGVLNFVTKKYFSHNTKVEGASSVDNIDYAKLDTEKLADNKLDDSLNHYVHTLYVTLEAFLNIYDVHAVQETWNRLNETPIEDNVDQNNSTSFQGGKYKVTVEFIKKYKDIMKSMKELHKVFKDLKSNGDMPDILNIFIKLLHD